jgi:hypothetical protein
MKDFYGPRYKKEEKMVYVRKTVDLMMIGEKIK